MKEIGGYFGLEQLISNEFYKDLIALNSGRNALLYILKARKIKKLYIPFYICNSITDLLKVNNYEFEYYRTNSDFMPIFDIVLGKDEYIYVINYYGQFTDEKIINLKEKFGRIIMDYTQAFFQRPIIGIDSIYTCRKFFGVPDGAYLSTNIKLTEELALDISKDRMTHILGRNEGTATDFYDYFHNNEKIFKSEPIKYMSKLTHNILGAIDYHKVIKLRNDNYIFLDSKLSIYNKIKLQASNGAFAYPLFVKNGIDIRQKLNEKKVFIPMLWPNVLDNTPEGSIEHEYVKNILPLPCDQRYEIEDMDYIVEEIKKFV